MIVDDPATLAEVTAKFQAYETALMTNDVAALDDFFLPSPLALRFGVGESLFGFDAIASFRAACRPRKSPVSVKTTPSPPPNSSAPAKRGQAGKARSG